MVYLPIAGVLLLVLWLLLLPAAISGVHAVLRVRAQRSAHTSGPAHPLKIRPQRAVAADRAEDLADDAEDLAA